MTESGFLIMKSRILQMLGEGLSPRLTYHSRKHTEDVLQQAERIAVSEKICDTRSLLLIKVAALFHDTGFLDTYEGHEERSCARMMENIDRNQFDQGEITIMGNMVMATKVSRPPVTLFEMVICDADLDYLGRNDFALISNSLREELLSYSIIKNDAEWEQRQVDFLEKHTYYTTTSRQNRQHAKMEHLERLKQHLLKRVSNYTR